MSNTSSTQNKMSLTMWQKEQKWSAWWADRAKLMQDDGTRTSWEKEQAVIREKKNWWFYTFNEHYWTVEDKELQWRNQWESVHGVGSEPVDGLEKRQWWRKTWRETPPLSGPQIDLAREEEIAAARVLNKEQHEEDFRNGFCRTVEELAALRARVEWEAAEQPLQRPISLPGPPMENPLLFGCPGCSNLFPNRRDCDTHIKVNHGTGEAQAIFHPKATEEELKACLFVNLPWQDKAMLTESVRSSDMDLCYVTKRLVLREPEYDDGHNPFTDGVR